MTSVEVDRIILRVPGVERELGERLARLVAERLVPALALAPAEASVERLRVELIGARGESPEALATRIVAQVSLVLGDRGLEAGR